MKLSIAMWAIVAIFAGFTSSAHAYLDPGTGSILLQGLIAAVATGLATGRFWWHRVKGIFVKPPEPEEDSDSPTDHS